MKKLLLSLFLITLLCSCTSSYKTAQKSIDRYYQVEEQTRQAFFVKSWGLNRALGNEARQKWVLRAELDITKLEKEGKLNSDNVAMVLQKLNNELSTDETVISENFAYLSFLLVAGEKNTKYLDIVDQFIESKKPIFHQLVNTVEDSFSDFEPIIEAWKPIISNIANLVIK
jgi:hypothetical protein